MKHRLILLPLSLGCGLALVVIGCRKREPKASASAAIPFQLVDRSGAAAMEFTNWTIVFEAIPARSVSVGGAGVLSFAAGTASGGDNLHGLRIRQFAGKDAVIVSVNNYTFKLMTGARRISFNDHFYELKQGPKTIVVGKDGKTHEEQAH